MTSVLPACGSSAGSMIFLPLFGSMPCDHMPVGRGGIQSVFIDRQALHPGVAAVVKLVRQCSDVLPENAAVRGADRFHRVAAFNEEHAIVRQRRGLIGTARE